MKQLFTFLFALGFTAAMLTSCASSKPHCAAYTKAPSQQIIKAH